MTGEGDYIVTSLYETTLASACMNTYGGCRLAVEYHGREQAAGSRLPVVALIRNNLVLSYIGRHVLGMPRSF